MFLESNALKPFGIAQYTAKSISFIFERHFRNLGRMPSSIDASVYILKHVLSKMCEMYSKFIDKIREFHIKDHSRKA